VRTSRGRRGRCSRPLSVLDIDCAAGDRAEIGDRLEHGHSLAPATVSSQLGMSPTFGDRPNRRGFVRPSYYAAGKDCSGSSSDIRPPVGSAEELKEVDCRCRINTCYDH
jgi:hypothetical protein